MSPAISKAIGELAALIMEQLGKEPGIFAELRFNCTVHAISFRVIAWPCTRTGQLPQSLNEMLKFTALLDDDFALRTIARWADAVRRMGKVSND